MAFPSNLQNHIATTLQEIVGTRVLINKVIPLPKKSSFHQTFRVETSIQVYFLKINFVQYLPQFQAEAKGLDTLRRYLPTPEVILVDKFLTYSFILLQYIEEFPMSRKSWTEMGIDLAYLHQHTSSEICGFEENNYLGTLLQYNTKSSNWVHFFRDSRLRPLVEQARTKGLLDDHHTQQFTKLYVKLADILPPQEASLLHGDMWGGNHLFNGQHCVYIDPAPYYGHREAELAMTTLFRQIPAEFYEGYNAHFPLVVDWQSRIDIYNLYPLLVHLVLFGTEYRTQIEYTLNRYC
jgi:protein-ribulosamine 3-kinase